MTEDEMVGWHHQLDGHESEQAPGVGNGQGSLVCCSPWGRKESDTTEQLNCWYFLPFPGAAEEYADYTLYSFKNNLYNFSLNFLK